MGSDKLVDKTLIRLNMAYVSTVARTEALKAVAHPKERIRDDIELFTRAGDHIRAAILYLEASHFAPDELQLELPF